MCVADNAGYQPIDVTIQEDGETAYFTSLPVKAMVQSIKMQASPPPCPTLQAPMCATT